VPDGPDDGCRRSRTQRPRQPRRPQAELLAEALKTAQAIAAMPPLGAIAVKELVNLAFETTLDQGIVAERRTFQVLCATDKAEGMAAFVEKRAGVWKGK
jgi:enoyl-CoA hydratase